MVEINEKTTGLELHVPLGGMKDSSSETYREQGDAGLDFCQISETVYDDYCWDRERRHPREQFTGGVLVIRNAVPIPFLSTSSCNID